MNADPDALGDDLLDFVGFYGAAKIDGGDSKADGKIDRFPAADRQSIQESSSFGCAVDRFNTTSHRIKSSSFRFGNLGFSLSRPKGASIVVQVAITVVCFFSSAQFTQGAVTASLA